MYYTRSYKDGVPLDTRLKPNETKKNLVVCFSNKQLNSLLR